MASRTIAPDPAPLNWLLDADPAARSSSDPGRCWSWRVEAGALPLASALPAIAEAVGGGAVLVSPYDHRVWATEMAQVIGSEGLRQDLVRRGTAVAQGP